MRKLKSLAVGIGIILSVVAYTNEASAGIAKNVHIATYKVTFVPTFTPETHSYHYRAKEPRPTHFSPLIGATYKKGYYIYKKGTRPTSGLELLSEHGRGDGLQTEMDTAKKKGLVYSVFTSPNDNYGPVPKSVEMTFKMSQKFPLVSVVGMIAPSPDWFMGVSNVRLYRKNHWESSKTVKAYAYDSGGDAGKDYTSPDKDLNPKQKTNVAKTKHFIYKGRSNPVGSFVFTKIPNQT